jgi:hypothetical protein
LTISLFLLGGASAIATEDKKTPSLNVYYEKLTGRLTVKAADAPLDKVLALVAKNIALAIAADDDELLQTKVSAEIALQPFEEAIKELLREFNTLFIYSPPTPATIAESGPVLSGLKIVSRKRQWGGFAAHGNVIELSNSRGRSSSAENVAAAADENQAWREHAAGLLAALKRPGHGQEKEEAVESLVALLYDAAGRRDPQTFSDILSGLKEHAPDRAIDPLADILRRAEEDRAFRSMAAKALGEIGNDYAVDVLIQAFDASDRVVQANVANSLARLGSDRSLKTLLAVFDQGDRGLHQTAATALATSGNSQATQALRQAIASGKVAGNLVPKDVVDKLK